VPLADEPELLLGYEEEEEELLGEEEDAVNVPCMRHPVSVCFCPLLIDDEDEDEPIEPCEVEDGFCLDVELPDELPLGELVWADSITVKGTTSAAPTRIFSFLLAM